jgi:hypothetical protein
MAPSYLESAVNVLEAHPRVAFVAAEVREFHQSPPLAASRGVAASDVVRLASKAEFVRGLLRGLDPMFGSVMYRQEALGDARPECDRFGTLADRPFLLALLEPWHAAIIREPLVWYRAHEAADGRHAAMTADHIVNLLARYRSTLPARLTNEDRRLFFTFSAYWLFALYDLVPVDRRPLLAAFLLRVWRTGLYEPGWRGRFGLRVLLKAAAGRRRWA